MSLLKIAAGFSALTPERPGAKRAQQRAQNARQKTVAKQRALLLPK